MARTVTLEQLRSDIEAQADFVGATQRYPDSITTRFINQAIQRFRERLSNDGVTHYLTHTTASLGVGATSPFPFYVLDLSAVSPSVVRVYGVDLTLSGGEIVSLTYVPFRDRASYGGPNRTDTPLAWSNYQTNKLAIMPPPSSALTYVAWYLPVLADLSADGDTFNGNAGWEDFIVWDVMCRHMIRDRESESYGMADSYRRECWADILRTATKVAHAGGAVLGRDTMGARMIGRQSRRGRLPPP